ncbi:DUF1918 domain-containing protein [Kitasatospora sp. NBC_00240]|uniref:DUF1918 domain-containing protein n=1 Tax=Kitasatospora sp. NBC_00240 TaxID=2903567 RepID=UPI0022561084|nr:DUF1918 domain-containing protein [Kitasatospora sp. NBC_00240]MCX5208220.1 DUF1918 domain-containing protein [Kitasatospora sp. NBC_00240]
MRAAVGDRIIVQGTRPGAARRDGEIVALHHPDGSPPYDVRWSEDGRVTEYFPGPDARIHQFDQERKGPESVVPQPHLFAD